ncbi:MAG: putative two-component system response regulator, LuxR family protein [Saprospiraceae bacterium]|nr:MAG: putative two-component system response regulator, LuxR family protein [Saprospiraceae bacterium]
MIDQQIRVFVADDHGAIIDGFKNGLIREKDLVYVGSAGNLEELKSQLKTKSDKIDVLLLDVLTEGSDFFSLIEEISKNNSGIKILILSGRENLGLAKKTIECGAKGYLSKVLRISDIFNTIREVFQFPHMTHIKLANPDIDEDERNQVKQLITPRELQVISLLCKGFPNNEEIAEFLVKINKKNITAAVVQTHRRNIRAKLRDYGVTNDASLGYWVAIWRLLDGSELSSKTDSE